MGKINRISTSIGALGTDLGGCGEGGVFFSAGIYGGNPSKFPSQPRRTAIQAPLSSPRTPSPPPHLHCHRTYVCHLLSLTHAHKRTQLSLTDIHVTICSVRTEQRESERERTRDIRFTRVGRERKRLCRWTTRTIDTAFQHFPWLASSFDRDELSWFLFLNGGGRGC